MVQIIKNTFLNTLSKVLCILIRGYQILITPILPKTCRFYPSCSEYSLTAIQHFGLGKGLWKSLSRLFRCHPWAMGGYDPILPNEEKS